MIITSNFGLGISSKLKSNIYIDNEIQIELLLLLLLLLLLPLLAYFPYFEKIKGSL
jgi:hypothetical protein